uniref:Putative secreted protein n=1 Tax=Anopheles marajoara TaxID=58244 RepID=A0A2M4CEZ6_9DIPT
MVHSYFLFFFLHLSRGQPASTVRPTVWTVCFHFRLPDTDRLTRPSCCISVCLSVRDATAIRLTDLERT